MNNQEKEIIRDMLGNVFSLRTDWFFCSNSSDKKKHPSKLDLLGNDWVLLSGVGETEYDCHYLDKDNDQEACSMKVNSKRIRKGWSIFKNKYPTHFSVALQEKHDLETADIFLQCICFGEIIYG